MRNARFQISIGRLFYARDHIYIYEREPVSTRGGRGRGKESPADASLNADLDMDLNPVSHEIMT